MAKKKSNIFKLGLVALGIWAFTQFQKAKNIEFIPTGFKAKINKNPLEIEMEVSGKIYNPLDFTVNILSMNVKVLWNNSILAEQINKTSTPFPFVSKKETQTTFKLKSTALNVITSLGAALGNKGAQTITVITDVVTNLGTYQDVSKYTLSGQQFV